MFGWRKILSFALFGCAASATYAALFYWATVHAGMPVFAGSLFAFLLSTPVSYLGNRWVTYRSKNRMGTETLRYLAVQFFNMVVTASIVHAASKLFGLKTLTEIVVAIVTAPTVSFVLYELWVYRQHAGKRLSQDTRTELP
jgi:putative flippase GtrA